MPLSVPALRKFFRSEPQNGATGADTVISPDALAAALESSELDLVYLPRVDIATQRTVGIEALLRWPIDADRGIPPLQFIPVAERAGLMPKVTDWVLDGAFGQLAQWRADGLPLEISVNLAMSDVQEPDRLLDSVRTALRTHHIEPAWTTLEIPAHVVFGNPEAVLCVTSELRRLGAKIAIDDYACAYGTPPLPLGSVDAVKIDRNFVLGMVRASHDKGVVAETLKLARASGTHAIAEGVFSRWTWESLVALDCPAAEGFYISPPQTGPEITRWLGRCQWPVHPAQ